MLQAWARAISRWFVPASSSVNIFGNLTVRENLLAVSRSGKDNRWNIDTVCQLFSRLAERADNMGSNLSGGEQQMLAIVFSDN